MKKLKLLVLICPILFSSCDEKRELMWYTDVDPDKAMTSMIPFPWTVDDLRRNSILQASSTGHDSIVSSAIADGLYDLNNDGLADFDFRVTHVFLENGQLSDALIYLSPTKNYDVSLSDLTKGYIKKYSFGEALDYESFGNVDLLAFLIKKDQVDNLDNNGEFYISVKMQINNKPHYGWFLVDVESASLTLTVKEFALCKIAEQKVTIGQRN